MPIFILTFIHYITILYSSIDEVINLSTIDLVILGYLLNKDKSAYEMIKEFENWNLNNWIKISNPAIYKNIVKLSEKRYLESRIVKEGEMPEKTIYSINLKGREHFYKLMKDSSENITNIYFSFSGFLTNLHHLNDNERKEMIIKFCEKLKLQSSLIDFPHIEEKNIPDGAKMLIDLYIGLFDLLNHWTDKVLDNYH